MIIEYTEDGSQYVANKLYVGIESYNKYRSMNIDNVHVFHDIKRKDYIFQELELNDYDPDEDERFDKMPKVLVNQIKNSIKLGAELLHIHLKIKK